MTREEEIEKLLDDKFDTDLYDYKTDNSYCNYCAGFRQGVEWANKNPKSPWISVEDDLPCNHEDYINTSDKDGTFYVIVLVKSFIELSRMEKDDAGTWHWTTDKPSYWMPIPKLPKE